MPIIRYALFAASFIVALLYALDHYLPPPGEHSAARDVDRSIIRIRSARALPEKIVFDTTARIAAAVSTPVLADEPPDHPPRDALAMAEAAMPEAKATPRLQRAIRGTRLRMNRPPHPALQQRFDSHPAMARAF